MTIKECIKAKGILIDCEVVPHRCGNVEVFFLNTADGAEDSTNFDVQWPLTKVGAAELESLYKEFCRENKIKTNTVELIQLNSVAEY
ncbi:hypothetical protein [Butyrivibrio sp. WCD2001]|uniref:hypothetical protein n=1 Tax=Butyrivibrio sp. WCD2001 TaxID=1280681 RepID=UPI0004010B37|nr:hypothetical protein [Butyrivibrio sp. WCD2001]